MIKRALVTGASSGIGQAIGEVLCEMGYEVYGIGRDFDGENLQEKYPDKFTSMVCDITDTDKLEHAVKNLPEMTVLVNAAGVGYYGLHEEINPNKIKSLVRTNLEAPMVLTQLLLRGLKKNKGTIINISSVTASKTNPHGAAYGATKAGLTSFSESLFEETRKYGVRVITIQPDMTKTDLYRNADFKEGEERESYLLPEEVADAVKYALTARDGMVLNEITLSPQIHRIQRKKND